MTEGHEVSIGLVIDEANRHDMKLVRSTLDSLVVTRPAPMVAQPQGMCLDKGYDSQKAGDIWEEFGGTAHMQSCGEEASSIKTSAHQKARCWGIERTQA